MKKTILQCFLGFLCLIGSEIKAQSRVGFSPGADFLHNSMPLRGGETRSDFIHPTVAHEIDGGPHLRSSYYSLPEFANLSPLKNETSSLSNSVDRNESLHRSSGIGHPATLTSQKGFSLVDDSISLGQGSFGSPADEGGTGLDSLVIGDRLPEGIEFLTVINNQNRPIHLDDYKGKYLILQFWAPTCSASIGSLPNTQQLNNLFEGKLEILPVTVFSQGQILETLEAFPTLDALEMPMAVEASGVFNYFPHTVIPHFVVLSPEREVLAITGLEDINEHNLRLLVEKGEVAFRAKTDSEYSLDPDSKLISGNPQLTNKNIWFQSAFTGYIPEVSGSLIQHYDEFSHIRIVNMTLIYHYRLAYSERSLTDYFGKNRIETIGFEENELFSRGSGQDYKDWKAEGGHVFGYELIAPIHLNPYQLMREDLKRFLPYIEASVETKSRKVLALVQQEGKTYPKSAYSTKSYQTGPQGVSMKMYPLDGFVYHLNAAFLRTNPIPVINLTGIDYPIDLELDAKLSDVESLRKAFMEKGFDLIEREEEIPVLVLRKVGKANLIGK